MLMRITPAVTSGGIMAIAIVMRGIIMRDVAGTSCLPLALSGRRPA